MAAKLNENTCTHSRDPLTGLPGRAFLQARLRTDAANSRRLGQALSVLALDLDHFQQLNAQYLLPAGDQVLVQVARMITSLARPGDLVARDGGDQFTVIVYDVNHDEAYLEAERIRVAIASTPLKVQFQHGAFEIPVTVSIGIATLAADDADAWQLFVRARAAVHQAKKSGRNRVA